MGSKIFRIANVLALTAMLANTMSLPFAMAGDWPKAFRSETSVEKLAKNIDRLQSHLDSYGTIVPKTPDVWGESRLLAHRVDFENQLKLQLDQFQFRLNARESTNDSAFLASALALGTSTSSAPFNLFGTQTATGSPPAVPANAINVTSVTTPLLPNIPAADDKQILPRSGFGIDTTSTGTFLGPTRNDNSAQNSSSIEPTIFLDQLKRYLDHLNEIRRANEGDDIADSPGYTLNLIRIPVSVLPGKKTREGYGAEVTVTAKPVLSQELLPTTFRDLVINGAADRVTATVVNIADQSEIPALRAAAKTPSNFWDEYSNNLKLTKELIAAAEKADADAQMAAIEAQKADAEARNAETEAKKADADAKNAEVEAKKAESFASNEKENETAAKGYLFEAIDRLDQNLILASADHLWEQTAKAADAEKNSAARQITARSAVAQSAQKAAAQKGAAQNALAAQRRAKQAAAVSAAADKAAKETTARQKQDAALKAKARPAKPNGTLRGPRLAISPTQQFMVSGHTLGVVGLAVFDLLAEPEMALDAKDPYPRDQAEPGKRGLSYEDVKRFIRRELQASYEFLRQPNTFALWGHCNTELVRAIRETRDNDPLHPGPVKEIYLCRQQFFNEIQNTIPEAEHSTTANLAWHIIVESALLNEQLIEDMKSLAAKNTILPPADGMIFHGPNPSPEARQLFNDYVTCRWPIHVFALDPITQDQNIGESFSRRRELQLVLALAESRQLFGVQSLTRFARRLEYDLETIELNRTAIGFSHGDDTFGWRFYPRVQTPPVPSNMEAIGRDLLVGSQTKDQNIRTRRLEPGIRECTALVVLPSFVPFVTVDTRTNWFRLADYKLALQRAGHRTMDVSDAVDLSRELTELRELSSRCAKDTHKYRDGEVWRLLKSVDQLERQLPMQTSYVPMPYENTLSGFEIFNSGITDLGPQLLGWYGAPGIRVGQASQYFEKIVTGVAVANANLADANSRMIAARALPVTDSTRAKKIEDATQPLADATAAAKAANEAYLAAKNAFGASTSLFLIGNNFSVLNSKVIAGGQALPSDSIKLISRELLQVDIPTAVNLVRVEGQQFVDIHIATPYGATSHLHVPAILPGNQNTETADALRVAKAEVTKDAAAQATAAAVAEVAKSVPPSLKSAIAPTVRWVLKQPNGSVRYKDCKLTNIELMRLELDAQSDDLPFEQKLGRLACFVEYTVKDATNPETTAYLMDSVDPKKKAVIGPFDVIFGDRMEKKLAEALNAKLVPELNDNCKGPEITSITIYGFVQLKSNDPAPRPDAVPVLKIEPLKITLTKCPSNGVVHD